MPDPALSLYEALRALEHRAAVGRRKAGLPSSRREAAATARRVPYEVELDSRRISSWLPANSSSAQVPRAGDADKVWALIRVWSDWAGDRAPEQRYWMDLIDAAQPARSRQTAEGIPAVGWPLGDVNDPFALEVHQPVQPDTPQPDLPALPAYVPREHDGELAQVVTAAAAGSSRIAVLVGGSSTGKTRACWEGLRLLRDEPEQWRLWHPIDPSRPEAALRELPAIGPRTVVWLNEAQSYLASPGGLGERVAAGLRELLRDPARGPMLVLATMWPSFWDVLTTRPLAGEDLHAQARELLAGRDIAVPGAFTGLQLQRLSEVGDVRLTQAAQGARDGQVIQFLAGAPELLARYRNAPPPKALIHAAMDARRLGMRPRLPHAFLEPAASGYLTDSEWDQLGEDWLERALAYTAAPSKGVRGPLTRIRPRPAGTAGSPAATGSAYLLADYLDQHGRGGRATPGPGPRCPGGSRPRGGRAVARRFHPGTGANTASRPGRSPASRTAFCSRARPSRLPDVAVGCAGRDSGGGEPSRLPVRTTGRAAATPGKAHLLTPGPGMLPGDRPPSRSPSVAGRDRKSRPFLLTLLHLESSTRRPNPEWRTPLVCESPLRILSEFYGRCSNGRNLMLLLHGECSDGKTCRALHRTDRGTVVIQSRAVTNREALQQFRLPPGEQAVDIPAELVAEVLRTC